MSANPLLFKAMSDVASAHLSNPNTRIETAGLKDFLQTLHATMKEIYVSEDTPARPAGAGLDSPFLPAPSRAALPAPAPSTGMTDEARASLMGASAFVGGDIAAAGEHLMPKVWQGVPRETQQKFRKIINEFNIPIGRDGYPIPRRPVDKLISETRMQVADPITGEYHTMLRRHLRLAHSLEHEELLAMFNFTESQLPCTGPAYSESKAEQARRTRLGHRTPSPETVSEEAQPRTAGRRRRKVAA